MSEPTLVIPIDEAPRPALSIDDAVRAALMSRPSEARSFGNEDDVEGPRPAVAGEPATGPTI